MNDWNLWTVSAVHEQPEGDSINEKFSPVILRLVRRGHGGRCLRQFAFKGSHRNRAMHCSHMESNLARLCEPRPLF